MQTIDLLPGTGIEDAAKLLVASQPARATFNDIPIRARYATTRPEDIVRHYHIRMDLSALAYRHSPAGLAAAARDAADIAAKQGQIRALVAALPSLDFADPAVVLAWILAASDPADRIGVKVPMTEIAQVFGWHGWHAGANCGEDFDGENERNFAGWIVGQWLATGWPLAARFVADWRAKFRPEAQS